MITLEPITLEVSLSLRARSVRYVSLCDGRKIGLGAYVAAWRQCLALPTKTPIGRGVDGWGQNAGEALHDLRRGLDDRINRHLPWFGRGRKWDSDWYWGMHRAASELNYRNAGGGRLAIHSLPPELRTRFEHRLTRH